MRDWEGKRMPIQQLIFQAVTLLYTVYQMKKNCLIEPKVFKIFSICKNIFIRINERFLLKSGILTN